MQKIENIMIRRFSSFAAITLLLLTSCGQQKKGSDEKRPLVPESKSAPTAKVEGDYTLEQANEIILQSIASSISLQFQIGQKPIKDRTINEEAWARAWMNTYGMATAIFKEKDFKQIVNLLESYDNAVSIKDEKILKGYEKIVQPLRNLAYQRMTEFLQSAASVLSKKEFDLDNAESLSRERTKPFPKTDADRKEQIRQYVESRLLSFRLAGMDDATAQNSVKKELELDAQELEGAESIADAVARYLNSFLSTLDPHSNFMAKAQARSFMDNMSTGTVGIGALLQKNSLGQIQVVSVVEGSPAEKHGILEDDILLGIYDEKGELISFEGKEISAVVPMIRGKENSVARLRIRRSVADEKTGEKTTTELEKEVVRAPVSFDDQRAHAMVYEYGKQKVVSISANAFYSGLTKDVVNLYLALSKDLQATGVILDLSKNGGGSIEEAVSLPGLFVGTAPIVRTVHLVPGNGRRKQRLEVSTRYDQDPRQLTKAPVVVKIDSGSASASEITAAALQDLNVALVVGEARSYGKGTIQAPLPAYMSEEDQEASLFGNEPSKDPFEFGMLKLTIGAFYRITGQTTQFNGVQSDISLYPRDLRILPVSERSMPAAMNLPTIDPDQSYREGVYQFYFDAQMKEDLVGLAGKRNEINPELQALSSYYRLRSENLESPLSLKLSDHLDRQTTLQKSADETLKVLESVDPITDLRVTEYRFAGGKISKRDVKDIQDTKWKTTFKAASSESAKKSIRLAYEAEQAEMEAVLSIFNDIYMLHDARKAAPQATNK